MTWLVAAFLVVHGVLHLAVWLPPAPTDPDTPPPFAPDHSAVLTAGHVSQGTSHRVAVWLAVAAAVSYLVTGTAVAYGAAWAVPLAVVAVALGLLLKALFFNPWLLVGIALDALVLASALASWPVSLT